MSDINVGTLYDLNKSVVSKEKPITDKALHDKMREVKKFCKAKSNRYYMLLNREKYDITILDTGDKNKGIDEVILFSLKKCLLNRGNVVSVELTEAKDAYEIWINTDDDSLVYYLFPYDIGVVKSTMLEVIK